MDSLLATYASSDDEQDEQTPQPSAPLQPHPSFKPSLSLFSSLPKPQSSSTSFSSIPSPKPTSQIPNQHSSSTPPLKTSALFSSLPPPKSETTPDFPLPPPNPNPKRVVQFRPPLPQPVSNFDDEDDYEEEEQAERERKKQTQLGQDISVKSFLSSMPTPKNSGSLGAAPSSLGSGRRSVVETLSSDVAGVEKEVGFESNVEIKEEGLVGVSDFGNYEVGVAGDQGYDASYDAYGSSSGDYDNSNWYQASCGEIGSTMAVGGVEGFASLGGNKRKNRAPPEIIEVKQDELMKNRPKEDKSKLTGIAFGPSYQPASTKGKPSKAHKRKHQIGSLYFDMRQKEAEFAERRAKGFLTKAETQAKYGW